MISRVCRYRCCCKLSTKSSTISLFFRNVSLSRKSTTRFAGSRFFQEKRHFLLNVKQKHTFYRRKSTKTIRYGQPSPDRALVYLNWYDDFVPRTNEGPIEGQHREANQQRRTPQNTNTNTNTNTTDTTNNTNSTNTTGWTMVSSEGCCVYTVNTRSCA